MTRAAGAPLRCLTSAEIRHVPSPTCGAGRRTRCVPLRDQPMESIHRGRATRYLHVRFAVHPAPLSLAARSATRLHRPGLHTIQGPHPQPWRLPPAEIGALVDSSFLDLAKVVTAEASGLGPQELASLLHGRDRIRAAIDALVYAEHDAMLRREQHLLTGLYHLIRTRLEPHQSRYGRLLPLDASTRHTLKRQVWSALDEACSHPESSPLP